MKNFDKQNLKTVRMDINKALAEVAAKHGISLTIGNISFTEDTFSTKLSAAIQREGQASLSAKEIKQQNDFKVYSRSFGFEPEDLNKQFKAIDGKFYTIVGARPRAKNCLVIKSVEGKSYACDLNFII